MGWCGSNSQKENQRFHTLKKTGSSPKNEICCFSLSNGLNKTDRVVHNKQPLRLTVWKWTLCNKPAAGIQTVFETSFLLLHVLSQSPGPFYIWLPVANPALPFQHHSLGRCWEPHQAAPVSVVRWCSVGGCGEPTQAALPAPRCWRNPSGAGLVQLEEDRLTFPAAGRLEQLSGCHSARHGLAEVLLSQ